MLFGVEIEKGPRDWQIIQQINGYAGIYLSGKWKLKEGMSGDARVFARIVGEDTGDSIIKWTECCHMDASNWAISIEGIPAGGLYRIETCLAFSGSSWALEWGLRGDMVHHFGVGDLYVIAGQSNAAGYGKDPAYDPPELGVHVFRKSGKWDLATHPLNDSTGCKGDENIDIVNTGSSPYITFAKRLKKETGYPAGLIQTAAGGSALCAWNPAEDGSLYRNMLHTINLCGGKIKGMLWYQGCTDADNGCHETYLERFKGFASNLRKDLSDDSLPFLTVQLNRKIEAAGETNDTGWGTVREAQRLAARQMKNVFIVPSADCKLSDDIHNSSAANIVLGERLAKTALAEIYGRRYKSRAPDICRAALIERDSIRLTFENVYGRLGNAELPADIAPFTVTDDEGRAKITVCCMEVPDNLILKLDRKLEGEIFISGAHEQNPGYVLPFDTEGYLPMLSFYRVKVESQAEEQAEDRLKSR